MEPIAEAREPGGQAGGVPDKRGTRRAILAVAQELFAAHGYAGTSVADITDRLGMSKAALYYHFRSKTEILRALLEEPIAAYSRLAGSAAVGQLSARDLLGAVIDTTTDLRALVDVIGNDPSARSALQDLLPQSRVINEAITAALAAPRTDPASIIRAHAAYAAAKNGTLALLAARGGHLTQQDRAELLAAAERALTAGVPAVTKDQEQDGHNPGQTPGTARLFLTNIDHASGIIDHASGIQVQSKLCEHPR